MIDVEQQMERARRRVERSIERDARAAMERIKAPTLTERAEIAAGVRLSPEEMQVQRTREQWARLGEAWGLMIRNLSALAESFSAGVARGAGRDTPGT